MEKKRIYVAIDLKSFYASVECMNRKLDPLTTHLVVADSARTEKTICLAVTPSLKAYHISGRARLFQVVQKVNEINQERIKKAPNHCFHGKSYDAIELQNDAGLSLTYICAPPQMSQYMEYSRKIYAIYLKYVSPEDIHVYSIDEVFIDVTAYLHVYGETPAQLIKRIIYDIYATTGITAAAGIGTNLYLCKVAMDIVAKHVTPDKDGVRIAQLDEMRYRKLLWKHRPLTAFWRVGRGYAKKLEEAGLYTMGDIARCSLEHEDILYSMFGVNAELLIDHAWGYEACTMQDIKNYRPIAKSIGTGQVLNYPYTFEQTKLVVKEMVDSLALDLVAKGLICDQIVLSIGYDIENIEKKNPHIDTIVNDYYGRKIPKHAHGTANLKQKTSSAKWMIASVMKVYDHIVNPYLTIRRIQISANHIEDACSYQHVETAKQMDLFVDYEALEKEKAMETLALEKEYKLQQATLHIKRKYGKNAVLKGMNLQEGATAIERNGKIGGHKA